MLNETGYSIRKRLEFIEEIVNNYSASSNNQVVTIADIGSGTGELLTIPLAYDLGDLFSIYALEPDSFSLNYLIQRTTELKIDNIFPVSSYEDIQTTAFDIVIASEVIEHVEAPELFLASLKRMLKPSGLLILTLPNAYGLFEIETMIFNTLERVGIIQILRKVKRIVLRTYRIIRSPKTMDTLAESPHINFFTKNDIEYLLDRFGFSVIRFEGKHLTAGPFSDRIIGNRKKFLDLNNWLGSKLPPRLVSGWLIAAKLEQGTYQAVLEENNPVNLKHNVVFRTYSNYKRKLNLAVSRRKNCAG